METIRLMDERTVPVAEIVYDEDSNLFYYQGEMISNVLTQRQKIWLSPTFDIERENLRYAAEGPYSPTPGLSQEPLPTGTVGIFAEQIVTEPFAAPIESASRTLDSVFNASGFKKLGGAIIIGAILWIVIKKG